MLLTHSNWEGIRPVSHLHLLLNTWHVSCLNKCNISLFRKTELNQILLRQDKQISFCKSRQEYRRQGICTAILTCILLPKLLSKTEDAHVDLETEGATSRHMRLTQCQLSMTRWSYMILWTAALEPSRSFGCPTKLLTSCKAAPARFTHLHLSVPWLPTWFPSQGTRQTADTAEDNPHCHCSWPSHLASEEINVKV